MRTESGRRRVARLAAVPLLLLPFIILPLFIGEIALRILAPRLFPHGQRCVVFDSAVHHRYKPGCFSSGGQVEYRFNEHGLRDRPSSTFTAPTGVIAVLGDSVAKGLWLEASRTVPSALERRLARPVLNGAVRFSSPTTQSLHYLRDIEPHYPVRGVVWLLNGSDPTDERFYRSRAKDRDAAGVPTTFSHFEGDPFLEQGGWLPWLHSRSKMVALLVRVRTFFWLRRSIRDYPASPETLCGGVRRLALSLKEKGIPLLAVLTPHYPIGLAGNWVGERSDPAELTAMGACAREAGAELLDLSGEPLERAWFLEDLIHYSPEGAEWLAGRISGPAAKLFSPAAAPPKKAGKRKSRARGSGQGS